jgi:HTH-type transcriptional regulator/antitoxin HigA
MKNMIKETGKSATKRKLDSSEKITMKLAAVNCDKKYMDCIKQFPLKPIRSEKENELAAQICDELLDKFDLLTNAERDYLEVLSGLIEHFESQWQEETFVEPRELLEFLMDQNGLSQTDLIPELGSSSRISEFLAGKRDLSLPQIIKLADKFNLSPTAFIPKSA